MIYRVLGVLSLVVGGIFGIVTMLVLLPFLDNFNLTLLILAGVFAILAYVFAAIGLQLFHPPDDRRRRDEGPADHAESEAMIGAAVSGLGRGPSASAAEADEADEAARPAASAAAPATERPEQPVIQRVHRPPAPGTTPTAPGPAPPIAAAETAAAAPPAPASEPAPDPAPAPGAAPASDAPPDTPPAAGEPSPAPEADGSSNGGAPLAHPVTTRAGFKKPGAAVPRD